MHIGIIFINYFLIQLFLFSSNLSKFKKEGKDIVAEKDENVNITKEYVYLNNGHFALPFTSN